MDIDDVTTLFFYPSRQLYKWLITTFTVYLPLPMRLYSFITFIFLVLVFSFLLREDPLILCKARLMVLNFMLFLVCQIISFTSEVALACILGYRFFPFITLNI